MQPLRIARAVRQAGPYLRHLRRNAHIDTSIAEDDRLRSCHVRKLLQEKELKVPPSVLLTIPNVLVQYWHDAGAIPADVRACIDSWEPLLRQGFERLIFDDNRARQFILRQFGPPYVTAFDACHHPAMRCDYFRLCYIFHCGGFYVDADEFYLGGDCKTLLRDNYLKIQPLCYDVLTDSMVDPAVFRDRQAYLATWIFYVNNNPLIAPPRHPVLGLALARSTRLLLRAAGSRLDIQSTTGPGNLTASLVRHAIASDIGGKPRDFSLLSNWETMSVSRWPLSYREDDRNWRRWRPN